MPGFNKRKTTWNKVASWYGKEVGESGHFYHQTVILPELKKILSVLKPSKILDLACGQGVLERSLDEKVEYVGVDIAPDLIGQARKSSRRGEKSSFVVADVSKELLLKEKNFDLVTCILALQNIERFQGVFTNAAKYLQAGDHFIFVINHPMFRIPRASGWSVDPGNGKQQRWVSGYLSEQKIPIVMNPGSNEGKKKITWSFHVPLANYVKELAKAGFAVISIEEWASLKESQGKHAERENTARAEIPLFMAIVAKKLK